MKHRIAFCVVITILVLTIRVSGISRLVARSQLESVNIPYLVQLRHITGDLFLCSGTLVLDSFVVTAAHCITGIPISHIVAVGGAAYLHEPGLQRRIGDAKVHPKYDSENPNSSYDVAVLKMLSSMVAKNIRPIPLCSKPLTTGQFIQISGWGKIKESSAQSPETAVRTISVPVLAREDCQEQYGNGEGDTMITDTMFCADMLLQKESCQDDTGGPAVFNGEFCGFLSWGNGCIGDYHAGVYTNVSAVRPFIFKSIKEMFPKRMRKI